MDERTVRQKLFRLFHRDLGLVPITQTDAQKCSHCGRLTKPPIGRPDILILNTCGPSYVVEVKTLRASETSFSMNNIDDQQRKWLDFWEEMQGAGFIGLGIIRPHGQREFLEHLYLVPWDSWKQIEKQIAPYQSSIPYRAGKGFRRELQDEQLDLLNLCRPFELNRQDGRWHLPDSLKEVIIARAG